MLSGRSQVRFLPLEPTSTFYTSFAGRRRAELTARLREPLRVQCAADRLELARKVMDRICVPNTKSALPPAKAREAVFCSAAGRRPRSDALRDAAAVAGVSHEELLAAMFADLPGEKLLPAPPADLNPVTLALRANLALVDSWLARATRVELALAGNARDIVRYALLRGLLCREPAPIAADGTLIFPDFELVHRRNERRRAWLEVIGFWTPTYLTDKQRRLRAARLERLILCIDASLNCGDGDLPDAARVVRFKRRIDPGEVLAMLEA